MKVTELDTKEVTVTHTETRYSMRKSSSLTAAHSGLSMQL